MTLTSGYSSQSAAEILSHVEAGKPIGQLTGDWTIVEQRKNDLSAVASAVAAIPVYYAVDAHGTPHAGNNVFEVASKAGLPWEWNSRAIQCLALFGHTLGSDTLHPAVRRLPSDTILTVHGGVVSQESLRFWDTLPTAGGSCRAAVDVLLEAVRTHCAGHPVLLSLSAGFDSRLLLALCLESGLRPRCVTMGPPDGTDVEVAREICRREGLKHERIELRWEDYLELGPEITALTSGVKLAANWHTYLYARAAAADGGEVHLVGANGEFARNYYLHRRILGTLCALPGRAAPYYWLARLRRRQRKVSSLQLHGFSSFLDTWRFCRRHCVTRGRLDESLARFYATQRVRHFVGAGLALYSACGRPRAPLLEMSVLREFWRLPRAYWSGDRFHREAIGLLRPSLLELPFNAPLSGPALPLGYSPFKRVVRSQKARDIVLDDRRLDELMPRAQREVACMDDIAAELLLTLAFAAAAASRVK